MLTPPNFYADASSLDDPSERSFVGASSGSRPYSPQSSSTTLPNLCDLLSRGISLLEEGRMASGLRQLQEMMSKIYHSRRMESGPEKVSFERICWKIQFIGLYHISYAYSCLNMEAELAANNKKILAFRDLLAKDPKFVTRSSTHVGQAGQAHRLTHNKIWQPQSKKYSSVPSSLRTSDEQNNYLLQILLVRVLLFSCFKSSRAGQHYESFLHAQSAKEIIVSMIRSLNEGGAGERRPKNDLNEKVEFSRIIGDNAVPILRQIKKDIAVSRVEDCQTLRMIKVTVSCWKKNPEHTKKELQEHQNCYNPNITKCSLSEDRSLLGVRSMRELSTLPGEGKRSQPQCIKDIIELQPVSYKDLCREESMAYELTSLKLKQKLELLCSAYFSMGIQLWNIEMEGLENHESGPYHPKNSNRYAVQSADKQVSQDMLINSELFILKAIGVNVSYLKDYENLLDNLVEVYRRKFQGSMMMIEQENSNYSLSNSVDEIRRTGQRLSSKLLQKQKHIQKQYRQAQELASFTCNFTEEILTSTLEEPVDLYYKVGRPAEDHSKSKKKSKPKASGKKNKLAINLNSFKPNRTNTNISNTNSPRQMNRPGGRRSIHHPAISLQAKNEKWQAGDKKIVGQKGSKDKAPQYSDSKKAIKSNAVSPLAQRVYFDICSQTNISHTGSSQQKTMQKRQSMSQGLAKKQRKK